MLVLKLLSLLLPLATAIYRDNSKSLRSLPAFTNSLVNLGKMDISFYFNAKPEDLGKKYDNIGHGSVFSPRGDAVIEEPCPCSNAKYLREPPKNNPSELLTKILTNKDLFSFNRDHETSALCCESHESVREDTIYFEMNPRQSPAMSHPTNQNQLPLLPFIFDNMIPSKPTFPFKPKTVEIILFPKKKEFIDYGKTKESKKPEIQVVGGKEIRNDFNTMKFLPPLPVQSSVKKDLAVQEKSFNPVTMKTETEEDKLGTTAGHPNTLKK